jgi:ankyrin repeat protein
MLLLEKGADMNIMADDKATPLHLASQQGCADVVAMLLAKGADINARDNQGHTPLARAKLWHQDAIVQLLQAHGGLE